MTKIRTNGDAGRTILHKQVHSFTEHSKTTVGLLVLGTQEEEAIYDILKISSPHSLIAELLGSADSKVVLQECSTEICPAEWGNAMQRLPQMSLENIHGYFLRTRAGTESHNMQTNLNWKVLR